MAFCCFLIERFAFFFSNRQRESFSKMFNPRNDKAKSDNEKGYEALRVLLAAEIERIRNAQKRKIDAHYDELTPPKKICYDEMFVASDKTDVVLIVEGKKLNVNKSFLSFHSDYFSTLFSANFKEGQMKEIEIKEVSYEDFGLLLSTIYPMQVFPNDETAEKLLELADRFLMPSAKHLAEHHLLNQSKLENEKMMMLGDRYGIKSILERSIRQTDSAEKMKKLKKSPEYAKLSLETVARLFERFVDIV
ncbi:hypothetical protein B9Z55_006807 [Caenorhabditis nigoni]|nr:hypothetical protein B9Z55_006807 [Caenorhabditis nigoni]